MTDTISILRTVIENEHDMPRAVLHCEDCGAADLGWYKSAAGWYFGTFCDCGPLARLSTYYPTLQAVSDAAENGTLRLRLWI